MLEPSEPAAIARFCPRPEPLELEEEELLELVEEPELELVEEEELPPPEVLVDVELLLDELELSASPLDDELLEELLEEEPVLFEPEGPVEPEPPPQATRQKTNKKIKTNFRFIEIPAGNRLQTKE